MQARLATAGFRSSSQRKREEERGCQQQPAEYNITAARVASVQNNINSSNYEHAELLNIS